MLDKSLTHARAHHDRYLAQLFELLSIPSISALSEHKADCQRAAEWLVADLTRLGIKNARALPTSGHPVVYGEWLEAGDSAPTVLIYGHYDVQPVDPLGLWHTPPFEPTVRAGAVYARGAVDDKGQVMLVVKALESMLAAGGALPVNVKLMIEGDEESNPAPLAEFVVAHKDLLKADSVLVCDTGFLAPGRPCIPYSLRGLAGAEVRVSGPKTDLHSGAYGGTVHNPVSVLATIIAALHDEHGHIRIPGFYDEVRALAPEERAALAAVPFPLEQWQAETGVQIPWGEPEFSLKERVGARPTCEVNGIWGGFQGEGGKTIIPAQAGAKFTMRLVADQDPEVSLRRFTDYVLSLAPPEVKIEIVPQPGCPPVMTPIDTREIQAAVKAYETVWGAPPIFLRGGGSIPVMATVQNELHIPIVMLGFGLPDSGGHAPNEHFELEQFYKGMEAVMHYCHSLRGG